MFKITNQIRHNCQTFTRSFFVSLLLLGSAAFAQNQMRTWTLPPNRLNFAPTAGTAGLPLASAVAYKVANGAYDANGNLLFYIKDITVYKADGTPMATLAFTTIGSCSYNIPLKEIAIAPVPNTCNQFYVFWLGSGGVCNSTVYLRQATVDLSTNTLTNQIQQGSGMNVSAGLAISKVFPDGNRKLFVVDRAKIVTYTIGASVAPFKTSTFLSTLSSNISEVELKHNNTELSWGTDSQFAYNIETY